MTNDPLKSFAPEPSASEPSVPEASGPARFFTEGRIIFLIVSACLLFYSNALGEEFVYDDIQQIIQNPRIRSWDNVWRGFTSHVWEFRALIGTDVPPPPYYRPLFTAYLTAGYQTFGLWAQGWHLASILVHTGVCVALFYLLRRLSRSNALAGLATLLFAIHPAHVESVAWISGVTDPMLALFFIPSLNLYMKYREEGGLRWLLLSLLLYALALLSKEPAIVLPGLIFVWEFFRRSVGLRAFSLNMFKRLLPYAGVTAAYMAARLAALGLLAWGKPEVALYPKWVYVMMVPRVFMEYMLHQVYPVKLSLMYDVPYAKHIYDLGVVVPLAFLLLVAALIFIKRKKLSTGVWVSLAFIILPVLPVLNLRAMNREWIVQDRYFYLSSIGLCYLAAMFTLWAARRRPRMTAALYMTLLVAMGVSTVAQNRIWMDSRLLWARAVEQAPYAYNSNFNLAMAYADHTEPEKARDFFHKTLKLTKDPLSLSQIYNNLTIIHMRLGESDEAIKAVNKAIEYDPKLMEAYNNLGMIYREREDYKSAAAQFRKALELVPHSTMAHVNLANTLMDMGEAKEALSHYEAAIAREKDDLLLRYQLSRCYAAMGNKDRAITELEWLLSHTDDPQVISFLQSKLKQLRSA
ncbi:MAG TPA: tetratricopeptide repeat protein [Pyrinomonadaceae bacterium]|nr:tetratricopeptide repeat protein [Pyrinomonadaceae bacterium]